MRTQTFGIEIETTGLGRQPTAEVIAKYFGTTAQYIGAHLDDWKIHAFQSSIVQYLLSSGYGIYHSGWHICQDKSAYPGIRKTSTAATVKV